MSWNTDSGRPGQLPKASVYGPTQVKETQNMEYPHHSPRCKYNVTQFGMCSNRRAELKRVCYCESHMPDRSETHGYNSSCHYVMIYDTGKNVYFNMKVCSC